MFSEEKGTMAIVGGGISGLTQALAAAEAGYKVTVFEESNRFGGKIQSAALDGKIINMGAEFIDSDQKGLIELAKKLGVNLIDSKDQEKETFLTASGKHLTSEEFHEAYKPLAELIIKDQKGMELAKKYEQKETLTKDETDIALEYIHKDKNGKIETFEEYINNKSLPEYLQGLAEKYKKDTGKDIDPDIIKTVEGAYASEAGRDPHKTSALQFINEASPELGSFLASDCAHRIEGGTAALLDKLKEHLEAKGVKFQTGSKLEELKKDGEKFDLGFTEEKFDKVGLALNAHALGQIKGLENLGMHPEERALLQNMQYTHSSKIFIKVKDGVDVDSAALFTGGNWQSWVHDKGIVTFLVGGEQLNNLGKEELTKLITEQYAKAYGKKAEDIFEKDENGKFKMVFGAPDTKRPCYATPAPGQLSQMEKLHGTMERMAGNGVALAGTYFPMEGSVGFMECGVQSAHKSVEMVKELSSSIITSMKKEINELKETVAGIGSWVSRVTGAGVNAPQPQTSKKGWGLG